MRHQQNRRQESRSRPLLIVDEECGVPTSLVDAYRVDHDSGPLAQDDPRTVWLSMSEYDKAQAYGVYDYDPATRPSHGQEYATFATPTYPPEYVAPQAQVQSALPVTTPLPVPSPGQHYGTAPDPSSSTAYYNPQHAQYPAYAAPAPRQLPELIDYAPKNGRPGSQITVTFRTVYDLDQPPVHVGVMFGHKRCDSVILHKDQHSNSYAATTTVPDLASTASTSPQVPLALTFDAPGVVWDSPTLEFGSFTYLDVPVYYPSESPQEISRKRKLSIDAATARLSPSKKLSVQQTCARVSEGPSVSAPAGAHPSSYARPNFSDVYSQSRSYSVSENQPVQQQQQQQQQPQQQHQQQQQYQVISRTPSYMGGPPNHGPPSMQPARSPSYGYAYSSHSPVATNTMVGGAQASSVMPSPSGSNPPLIRTSTLQSPSTPAVGASVMPQAFNPYAMYPSNTKAMLKLDGDLNKMADKWTPEELEAKRRLVQFSRTQSGSVITAKFEPVTPEERLPNSICVSCIWWEEKRECYVTSVDTISLLESLVAVRFTVEEKNRIRRNLEGFRPATVSKTKADSEEFFKIIMGFPNPKPRNIEKDLKVFPWRILHTALKKIIGKYSASYSSTAGVLHGPAATSYAGPAARAPPYAADRGEAQQQQRPGASPLSTSSSAYTTTMSAGQPHQPDMRLTTMPGTTTAPQHQQQTVSWHQPAVQYSSDLSSSGHGAGWESFGYLTNPSPITGMPGSGHAAVPPYGGAHFPPHHQQGHLHQHHHQIQVHDGQGGMHSVASRFIPLHEYEQTYQASSA